MRLNIKYITLALTSLALANAKLIMIIRHGEKVNDKETDLSAKGKARAYCLSEAFGTNGKFTTPLKIYAQSPSEKKQSTRPRDTVQPLADALGIEVDLSYTSGQVKKLAKDVEGSNDEVVLISWSNDNIPDIAEKFGITSPPDWDSDTFDEIWMLSDGTTPYYKNNGLAKRLTYAGTDGLSMEIIKQDVDDCIQANIENFGLAEEQQAKKNKKSGKSKSGSPSSVHFSSSLFVAIAGVFIYFIAAYY